MKNTIKSLASALLMLVCTSAVQAQYQKPISMDLWTQGLPNTNGIESKGYDDAPRNYKPGITVYLPKGNSKPACSDSTLSD